MITDNNEVILSIADFTMLIEHIKELEKANDALNAQIKKYNEYAHAQNKE